MKNEQELTGEDSVLQTSDKEMLGFSSSSPLTWIPVPWHSGQTMDVILLFFSAFFAFLPRLLFPLRAIWSFSISYWHNIVQC